MIRWSRSAKRHLTIIPIRDVVLGNRLGHLYDQWNRRLLDVWKQRLGRHHEGSLVASIWILNPSQSGGYVDDRELE